MTPGDVARLRNYQEQRRWSLRHLAEAAGVDKGVIIRLFDHPENASRIRADNARALLAMMDEEGVPNCTETGGAGAEWWELPPVVSFFDLFPDELERADAWYTMTESSHTYFEPEPMRHWHQAMEYARQRLPQETADELIAAEGRYKPSIMAHHRTLSCRHHLLLQEAYFAEAFRNSSDWAGEISKELKDLAGHTAISLAPSKAWELWRPEWGLLIGIGPVANFDIIGDELLIVRPTAGHSQLVTRNHERIRAIREGLEAAMGDLPRQRADVRLPELAPRRIKAR